jgi:hypothetical protein
MTDDKLDEKEFARRKLEHAIATRRAYAKRGMYLFDDIRDLDKIPTGQRLVHDRPPSHARQRKATSRFTIWLEADTPRGPRERCDCGWDAPPHWTVRRAALTLGHDTGPAGARSSVRRSGRRARGPQRSARSRSGT